MQFLQDYLESQRPLLLLVHAIRSHRKHWLAKTKTLLNPDEIIFRIRGKPNLTSDALDTLLSQHWAVRYNNSDAKTWAERLNFVLHCLTEHNQRCVLIIEQAHLLSPTFLQVLCYLSYQQENKSPHIRIIMAGHPDLIQTIDALYLKQFKRPVIIHASDIVLTENEPHFSQVRGALSKFWNMHSIKTLAVLALCISGFLWFKMQNAELLFHAKQQNIIQSHSIRTA